MVKVVWVVWMNPKIVCYGQGHMGGMGSMGGMVGIPRCYGWLSGGGMEDLTKERIGLGNRRRY